MKMTERPQYIIRKRRRLFPARRSVNAAPDGEMTEEKGYDYFGENKFFEKNGGLLNSYTPAMRDMNPDFRANRETDPQTNYVFILKYSGSKMERDAAGFMPRSGQFSYIFYQRFQER
jgi:hypothetical protein